MMKAAPALPASAILHARSRLAGRALAAVLLTVSVPPGLAAAQSTAPRSATGDSSSTRSASPPAMEMEEAYGEAIREHTTEQRFLSELVDHLPDHPTVPSPLDHFGHIVGTPGILHYTEEIHGYLETLADASPRVVYTVIGTSDEGREVVAVAVSDSAHIANLERHKGIARRLADPRGLSDEEAERLIGEAVPIYYATMGLHSPETGPPEMAMEIAYRLAVEETPFIRDIRDRVIFAFTPVVETDGRDRIVDWYYREKEWKAAHGIADSVEVPGFPSPPYWGKYVVHDNNRDALQLSQTLSKAMMRAYLDWQPLVFHDLHQSVPLLYVSTGTGPYNEYLDPVVVSEWNQLAYHEVSEMTKRGMPGVWTHGFYTGWASSYLIWMANLRNAIGRFYETFGGDADTEWKAIEGASEVEWYRTNPAPDTVLWSLRNNTNYMQTGLLLALEYTAEHGDRLLRNLVAKARRQVERGRREPPHAYAIPGDQPRALEAAKLVNLLREHGVEVHRLGEAVEIEHGPGRADVGRRAGTEPEDETDPSEEPVTRRLAAGDHVVRLDQPYHVVVRQILGLQRYPEGEPIPYDDTGWTLSLLRAVEAIEVADSTILAAPMELLAEDATYAARLDERRDPAIWAIPHRSQNELLGFRLALADVPMEAVEEPFEAEGSPFPAGSLLIPSDAIEVGRLRDAAARAGLDVHALRTEPDAARHPLEPPRIAFVHTWRFTQNSGWVRHALDAYGIPYDYISDQDVGRTPDLRSRWDVILFPLAAGDSRTIVHGTPSLSEPIAWRRSGEYRHIGVLDETDDMTGGMGLAGLDHLRRFVEDGGLLVTIGSTSELLIDFGIVRDVEVLEPRDLRARGTVVRTRVSERGERSPLVYGYWDSVRDSLPAYYGGGPIFEVKDEEKGPFESDFPLGMKRSRTVLAYADADGLLLSGGIAGEAELAGKAAVVDAPLGRGHALLIGINPFRRWQTQGTMPLVFNAILNWNDLDLPWRDDGTAGAIPDAESKAHEGAGAER